MQPPDVLIAGAGIIGLSLALELRRRGANVTVLESAVALGGASTAAAGMLASEDPHNPLALHSLARHSLSLYPGFLAHIEELSGQPIPFQTDTTVQYFPDGGTHALSEHSIDPRQLAPALLSAALAASVRIMDHAPVLSIRGSATGIDARFGNGERMQAGEFVHATGAWSLPGLFDYATVSPRKGQMLRITLPAINVLQEVHRAEHVYVVPRTSGPQAGTALIGATVENAGFNVSTQPASLQRLREAASALGPATAFVADAPLLEAWAGLRPSTPDALPLLGPLGPHEWIATGHFRNGILLAPGTAHLLTGLLAGRPAEVDLTPFDPQRFSRSPPLP